MGCVTPSGEHGNGSRFISTPGLPDHLHCIWALPPGDSGYSSRWRGIKITFAKSLAQTEYISEARKKRGERGLWQRRFWEHRVRDERDYAAHMDYVYINPLKHRLVQRVRDWPYSSFHRDVRNGVYPGDWAGVIPKIKTGERRA